MIIYIIIIDSHACAVSIIFKNSFLFLKIIIVGNRCSGIKIEVYINDDSIIL